MNGRRSDNSRLWLHLALAVWLVLGLGGSHSGQAAARPPDNLLPHRVWLPLVLHVRLVASASSCRRLFDVPHC